MNLFELFRERHHCEPDAGGVGHLLAICFERMERLEVTVLKRLENIMLTLNDIQNAVAGLVTSVSTLSATASSIGDNVTTLTTNTTAELAAIEKLLADGTINGGLDQVQAQALLDQIGQLRVNVDQAGSDIASRASDVATNATNIAAETAKIAAAGGGGTGGGGTGTGGDGSGSSILAGTGTGNGQGEQQFNELGGKIASGDTGVVKAAVVTRKLVSQNAGDFPQVSPHVETEKAQQAQNLAGDLDAQ